MRTLIIGCGYVGIPLGAELVRRGHEVVGVRRTADADAELEAHGIQPHAADITRPEDLSDLPGPFDWVVNCVSSTRGGPDEYRDVYLGGNRNLIDWLADTPLKKFVYTSSTSVYGHTDGSVVDESSATQPASETSGILVEAEQLLLDAARGRNFPAVILRAAGIYGPERGHLFLKYLRGEARISGRGERLINMIHRDDLAGCIIAALERGQPGEIYNATDDQPVSQLEFFHWLSNAIHRPMPPFATERENAARKRGLTQKCVLNHKLKQDLGYQFKYPTYVEGYTEEIRRLKELGALRS